MLCVEHALNIFKEKLTWLHSKHKKKVYKRIADPQKVTI